MFTAKWIINCLVTIPLQLLAVVTSICGATLGIVLVLRKPELMFIDPQVASDEFFIAIGFLIFFFCLLSGIVFIHSTVETVITGDGLIWRRVNQGDYIQGESFIYHTFNKRDLIFRLNPVFSKGRLIRLK